MTDMTAIILAAGLSRRMGERNKLLLPVNGMPMIRHMVQIYGAVTDSPILVVTGHEAAAIEDALAGCDVQFIHNPTFALGQQTSVAYGLRAAPSQCRILIGLGDQPRLTGTDLKGLLAAHDADPARISIPLHDNTRGNPIVIPGALRDRVLADPASPGCKTFTRTNPQHVQFHPLTAPGFYEDIDTPDAYNSLTGATLEDAT